MPQSLATIWSIGHSTRSIEEFLDLLRGQQIALLADVRQFPGSRRYPQFGSEQLAASLAQAGIEYVHFKDLGGRRRARPDSANTGWRNEAFRGYADYMETDAFEHGIQRLLEQALLRRTAMMCAEAVWWQCHRRLISDYLTAGGHRVLHILGPGKIEEHRLIAPARLLAGKRSYAAEQAEFTLRSGQ